MIRADRGGLRLDLVVNPGGLDNAPAVHVLQRSLAHIESQGMRCPVPGARQTRRGQAQWCLGRRNGEVFYKRKKRSGYLHLLSPETVPTQLILFQNNN